jgi:hypothetical protein
MHLGLLVFWLLNAAVLICGYIFWLRPILQRRPDLQWFWTREQSFFTAVKCKLAGIKQRLTAAVVSIASMVVLMHDQIAPLISGVDTTPFTSKLAEYVPQWMWPLGLIGLMALLNYFRALADKREDGC